MMYRCLLLGNENPIGWKQKYESLFTFLHQISKLNQSINNCLSVNNSLQPASCNYVAFIKVNLILSLPSSFYASNWKYRNEVRFTGGTDQYSNFSEIMLIYGTR